MTEMPNQMDLAAKAVKDLQNKFGIEDGKFADADNLTPEELARQSAYTNPTMKTDFLLLLGKGEDANNVNRFRNNWKLLQRESLSRGSEQVAVQGKLLLFGLKR